MLFSHLSSNTYGELPHLQLSFAFRIQSVTFLRMLPATAQPHLFLLNEQLCERDFTSVTALYCRIYTDLIEMQRKVLLVLLLLLFLT